MSWILEHADCLDAMREMPADSIDAIVTDPPAGIAFMGREWDKDKGGRDAWVKWMTEVARECLRVIKPGGHALVWAIPRTSHWTGWAWEDGGWEPRDKIVHLFGSGFPKSLSVSKALDKAAGVEREVVGERTFRGKAAQDWREKGGTFTAGASSSAGCTKTVGITAPATDAAKQWDGWGTALKPAAEDWWLFRKPLVGTVAANVLAHGTGAINVDACRIGTGEDKTSGGCAGVSALHEGGITKRAPVDFSKGRWPANVTIDEEAASMLDKQTGTLKSGGGIKGKRSHVNTYGNPTQDLITDWNGDSGGASRFFYTAKASRKERGEGNTHPTVKPLALMKWLVRLVCPPGGTVLDPFAGSGTTGIAALEEGFMFVGIEREAEYAEIARKRLEGVGR